jgi:hypothetical protein
LASTKEANDLKDIRFEIIRAMLEEFPELRRRVESI